MSDLEGKTLDRYTLRQLLAKGGMADVYLGYDSQFCRDVAIKVFKREDENLLRRFVREAHLMASLNNPRLIPVYDASSTEQDGTNIYYIVMPFIKGGTLRTRIRNHPLAPSEAYRYLRDIADALDYMHQQGIIHRDIKSSNVLLDTDDRCYLADFGIARACTDKTQMTSVGNIMGTVDYLAPELVETNQRADVRSDLYSLGVLLFEMVTGVLPFRGENQIAVVAMHVGKRPPSPRSIVPTISPALEQVIYKALEKQPELRYASATKMAEAFSYAIAKQSLPHEQLAEPLWNQATVAVSGTYIQDAQYLAQVKEMSVPPPVTGSLQAARFTDSYSAELPYHPLPTSIAYPPPQQKRKRWSSARAGATIGTIMAVLALLTILIPIIYANTYSSHKASEIAHTLATSQARQHRTATALSVANALATQQAQSATATAQAIAMASATAQANATATQLALDTTATAQAIATGIAQATAQAMATATVIQSATAGQPIYSDPFNNPHDPRQRAGWNITDNTCSFLSDGYHVTTTNSLQGCYQSAQQFQNFAAKVDLEIVRGHSGGLLFRANSLNIYSGYLFEVDSNGQYQLSRSTDFSTGSMTILQDWTASSALNKGFHVKNTLEVIAQGSNLKFYANGTFLTALQDTTFPHAAYLGLLGNIDAQNPTADVVYTNLSVYQA